MNEGFVSLTNPEMQRTQGTQRRKARKEILNAGVNFRNYEAGNSWVRQYSFAGKTQRSFTHNTLVPQVCNSLLFLNEFFATLCDFAPLR